MNLFAYCDGNPVNGADPSGLDPFSEIHHLIPRFLAGANDAYNLIRMETAKHRELTNEMRIYLKGITNEAGQDMQYRRGYAGAAIRNNFTPEARLDALKSFYSQNSQKFPEAAKQFLEKWGGQAKAGAEGALENGKVILEDGQGILQELGSDTEPLAQMLVEGGIP